MNKFKDFFYYTRAERDAVLILLFVILILFIFPFLISFFKSEQVVDYTEWNQDVLAFEKGISHFTSEKKAYNHFQNKDLKKNITSQPTKLYPFIFDPNKATVEDFKNMRVPAKTIKSIINYRLKGGWFYSKESFQKIYTLSNDHFRQLLPYIKIEEHSKSILPEKNIDNPLPTPFDFDPNTASEEILKKLGLTDKTTRSILNYRLKGGRFRKKEDFKKIYTLHDSVYQHLYSSIHIVELVQDKYNKSYKQKSYYKIDINLASSSDFQQFKGIGPSYANRILKMKDALGGFVSIDQIAELYKLPDSTFLLMRPFLLCENPEIRKININKATVEELKAHPYLRWFHAKAIVKYRETEGLWESVDLLQILIEFDDGKNTFTKVLPYLTIK